MARIALPLLALSICAVAAVSIAIYHNSRRIDIREHPLTSPLSVSITTDAALRLSDGRTLAIAGIQLPSSEPARTAAVQCMNVAIRQGVEIRSTLPDGSAFFICEPRFHNWCGTGRTSGWYLPVGLSELLITTGHATIDPNASLPDLDHKRLLAAQRIAADRAATLPIHVSETSIRCACGEQELHNLDALIANNILPYAPKP